MGQGGRVAHWPVKPPHEQANKLLLLSRVFIQTITANLVDLIKLLIGFRTPGIARTMFGYG